MGSAKLHKEHTEFVRKYSNWLSENGYFNKPIKWSFKIFHKRHEQLFIMCENLVDNNFSFSSVRWNRNPDYESEGWVASVFIIQDFDEPEFYKFYLKLEMWLLANGSTSLHNIEQELPSYTIEKLRAVQTGDAAELIESSPQRPPRHPKFQKNWKNAWFKNLEKEILNLNTRPKIELPQIDQAYLAMSSKDSNQSPLDIHFLNFTLKGKSVFFTDMRTGPSEDGIKVMLPSCEYAVRVTLSSKSGYPIFNSLKFVQLGKSPNKKELADYISIDGGTLGFYDYQRLRAAFGYDLEQLFSWGENLRNISDSPYGVLIYNLNKGYILPYVQTGDGDGMYPIYVLYDQDVRVGVEVIFTPN